MSYRRYTTFLSLLFIIEWSLLAINPHDRADWALENVLVLVAVISMVAIHKSVRLSSVSYTLIFVFLCLHVVGAHYTYSEVPYNQWTIAAGGKGLDELLGWERNQFDRIVHFLYGALLVYPFRELFLRLSGARGFWDYLLPLTVIMSTSMIFELIEWFAAELFGGDLGIAYLGTQGDVWDAHKDMALSTIGAVAVIIFVAFREGRLQQKSAVNRTKGL